MVADTIKGVKVVRFWPLLFCGAFLSSREWSYDCHLRGEVGWADFMKPNVLRMLGLVLQYISRAKSIHFKD